MLFKHLAYAGAAAAAFIVPLGAESAAATDNDTYICNDRVCYDDQAQETRELNRQSLYANHDDYDDEDDNSGYMNDRNSYDDEDNDGARGMCNYRDDDDDAYDNDDDQGGRGYRDDRD